jgi:nucleoside-diphosphate-sugar epimerase
MNITILGSAGQIGAYLSEYLKDKGHHVINVDIVNGVQYDLRVTPNTVVENAIQYADFVFFLAFDVGGSRYLKKYQHTFEFVNNNTRMMANTFRLLDKHKKRFVFASSQMSNMSYSPYGVMKRVGELHTTALKGLTVKFWNVYGIEKDMEKAHVITDFIRRGFEESQFEMLTDGTEERQFLYAEDCCEALEMVMENYTDFKPEDPLHITSFHSNTVREIANIIQGCFGLIDRHDVKIDSGLAKDSVQMDKRNKADTYILNWWVPKTTIDVGIRKVFNEMKKSYESN